MSLRAKTLSGLFWSFLQKIGSRGISFIVLILLARLLTPQDFGLVGMLTIFIQISQSLIEGGFGQALIQKLETDDEDYSSVFYINILVSSLLYILLFFAAPLVARFYGQAQLVVLLRVVSLVFIINSFSMIQETKMIKELKFKKLTYINLPSTLIGGVVSLIMAWKGMGVWSLVGLQLSTRVSYSIQVWLYAKWKPLRVFRWQRVKSLFNFGGKLLISNILTPIYSNLMVIVIGKFYPVKQVGFYQNAYNMSNTPAITLKTVVDSVTFPVFSSIQNDDKQLKNGYRKVIQQIVFWMFPIYAFAAILAEPIFLVIFGQKWLPAVPYFQWLCVSAVFFPLINYNLNILKVKGEGGLFVKLQVYRRVLTIIAVVAVFPLGITALLAVQGLSSALAFVFFSSIAGKYISYSTKEQIGDILPTVFLTILTSVFVYCIEDYLAVNNGLKIISGFLSGMSLFLFLARITKQEPIVYLWSIFNKRKKGFLSKRA